MTGDITSQIMLWDAGTEVNQEPGTGADQAAVDLISARDSFTYDNALEARIDVQ